MLASFKNKLIFLILLLGLIIPFPARAIFDFGGWVLNTPSTHAGEIFLTSWPSFPPEGVDGFWDSGEGTCLNGVQEVDILQAVGVPQPPILLQFAGQYTFSKGPASHPGQQVLGKYAPVPMVCMMTFVFWVYCGLELCPIPTPLPFFFAPLILFNGSSI